MAHSSFNPKSRWDKHIPQVEETDNYNDQSLNERIEVLARFRNGKIQPLAFIWNNKEYKIKNITYNWQERRGRETISYFSVNTGADLYQISFNNSTLNWQLNKLLGTPIDPKQGHPSRQS